MAEERIAHAHEKPGQEIEGMDARTVKAIALGVPDQTEGGEGLQDAQDKLYAYWKGQGVEKVMVESGSCTRCGLNPEPMGIQRLVGPKGMSKQPSGRMERFDKAYFPFIVTKALFEQGASCTRCGGKLKFEWRPVTPEEDW